MFKNTKLYLTLIKLGFLKNFTYKSALVFKVISMAFSMICQYFLWKAIFSSNTINNYDFTSMISYILLSQIFSNIYPVEISGEISSKIKKGDLSYSILKPIEFWELNFFESIGINIFRLIFINLPLIVLFSFINQKLLVKNIIFGLIIFMFSYIFYYFFELIIGLLSFFTMSSWGINSLKVALIGLLTGRAIPLNMYPIWAKKLVDILPFKILFDWPINIVFGNISVNFNMFLYLILIIFIQYLIYKIVFYLGLRKANVQGG